jgi:hypothetical protein
MPLSQCLSLGICKGTYPQCVVIGVQKFLGLIAILCKNLSNVAMVTIKFFGRRRSGGVCRFSSSFFPDDKLADFYAANKCADLGGLLFGLFFPRRTAARNLRISPSISPPSSM